ncbi:MAG: hypothetical protein RMM17_05260 [Acidobacteriota bacterium]|nr:hypothetical protein [Blastocatellia bacterium]MDW8412072.1 hypothetical protein [Acidobacteriota bacterium]
MKKEEDFEIHFQQGLEKFRAGKFAESLSEFFNAAQIDPTSAELHYYIGEALELHRRSIGASTKQPEEQKRRHAPRYNHRIPVIVVAYDVDGKFFAELASTDTTSVKGASIELRHRSVKVGAQLMIFTVDSMHSVPAAVRNVRSSAAGTTILGVEFLKGPIEWLLPPLEEQGAQT